MPSTYPPDPRREPDDRRTVCANCGMPLAPHREVCADATCGGKAVVVPVRRADPRQGEPL